MVNRDTLVRWRFIIWEQKHTLEGTSKSRFVQFWNIFLKQMSCEYLTAVVTITETSPNVMAVQELHLTHTQLPKKHPGSHLRVWERSWNWRLSAGQVTGERWVSATRDRLSNAINTLIITPQSPGVCCVTVPHTASWNWTERNECV